MLRSKPGTWPAYGASLLLHVALLASLAFIKLSLGSTSFQFLVDTQFTQEQPLSPDWEPELLIDSNLDAIRESDAGPSLSPWQSEVSTPAISDDPLQRSEGLRQSDLNVSLGSVPLPPADSIALDLGNTPIGGEVAAFVDGYGTALDRMMYELIRIMRKQRALVVWLFDESASMKDDQQEIRGQLERIYGNPEFVPQDSQRKREDEALLTAIHGFGETVHVLTPRATADIEEIRAAIDGINVDPTGIENVFQAVDHAIEKYYKLAARQQRRLVVVVVTDESGDDGHGLEDVIDRARRFNVPVYIMGREAVFGYKYARVRWRDPKFDLPHWLTINRGPETPFPEALQFDGLHDRWDVYSSGFGPYEQVRLAKQTGGVFFVLPGTEEDLAGRRASIAGRKFDFLDMQEYLPQLDSKYEYAKQRANSELRLAIAKVVDALDPEKNPELSLREHHYSIDPEPFRRQARENFDRALRIMPLLQESVRMLEAVEPLRQTEPSARWRANYDLILAECLAYRVRLFQFMLALDQHAKNAPMPENRTSNVWSARRRRRMLEPDAQQIQTTKVDMDELAAQESHARELLQFVVDAHPRTPWSRIARHELNQGFGMEFAEDYADPKYSEFARSGIPLPKY